MKLYRIAPLLWLLTIVSFPTYALDGAVESLRQTGKAFASVARAVSPSVVFIQVESSSPESAHRQNRLPQDFPFGDDLLKRFFGDQFQGLPDQQRPQRSQPHAIGQGSGFVFKSKDGLFTDKTYIMTNNHVVANADKITVKFQDGREFNARVTGTDPKSDVAVIEIKEAGFKPLPLGDSSKMDVGDWVVAIGNPFGLSHTLTVGVVSAKGRTGLGINDYEDFIQTDAAINPGNSGGPLVNLDGQAIGMNTAIFSRSGGYMGIGFAIPINLARNIADQLINSGEVTRGYLGIVIQELTPQLAQSFNIKESQGILVAQVSDDSPASKAGLQRGDIIVAYRDKPVSDVGDFRNRISLTAPGSEESLTILREGKRKTIDIKIGKLTKDQTVAQSGPAQDADELGLTVQTLTDQLAEQFNVSKGGGVIVTKVKRGSIAANAGIRPGVIIVEANRKPVNTASEFTQIAKKSSSKKQILLLLREGNGQRFVALSW